MRNRLLGLAALIFAGSATPADASEACPPYESVGTGPDLVLVPGLGSAPEVWDGVKDTLSEQYTVHLVHIAGFAGRPAEGEPEAIIENAAGEIVSYLDCKNIKSTAYAGHSMGGFLGMKIASETPGRIENLIIVDSLPFFPLIFSPEATPALALPQANTLRSQILGQSDEEFALSQRMGVRSLVQNADYHDIVVDWSTSSDRAFFANAMHTIMTTDLRPQLEQVNIPTTVIAAANAFAPRTRIETLYGAAYDKLDDAELIVVEDSFHFVMFDQPEAFASALQTALAVNN